MRSNRRIFVVGWVFSYLMCSCAYDYDSGEVTLKRGESYRGHGLSGVEADGVRLDGLASGGSGSTFYSREGRPHMGGNTLTWQ
jgi:hypothetical protein